MQSLFFLILSQTLNASPVFPRCPRPPNLAAPNALRNLETCQKNQIKFCDRFEKDPHCKPFLDTLHPQPETKNVATDCRITTAGEYRCKQKRLRFVEREEPPPPVIPKNLDKDETQPDDKQKEADGAATLAIPPPPPAKPIPAPNSENPNK